MSERKLLTNKKKSGEGHLVWLRQNPSNMKKCDGEEKGEVCASLKRRKGIFLICGNRFRLEVFQNKTLKR